MSVSQSIRDAMVPIHKEGYRFIAVFAAVTIALGFLWQPLFWIGLILTIWCALFFRDPQRVVPVSDDLIVSPADGVVSSLGLFVPPAELNLGSEPRMRITVFMNVFNCHVNRAPVRGPVLVSQHKPGLFLSADLDKASEDNERHSIVIDGPHGLYGIFRDPGSRHLLETGDQVDGIDAVQVQVLHDLAGNFLGCAVARRRVENGATIVDEGLQHRSQCGDVLALRNGAKRG